MLLVIPPLALLEPLLPADRPPFGGLHLRAPAYDRIDGIVALVMAIGRATVQPKFQSVYATRGILVIGE
jgi:hypothetical protein